MTQPTTAEQRVIDAQIKGAAYSSVEGPHELVGEPHSAERIMFLHGAMRGHGVCTCPVVDEHGNNVNPGRAPLDGRLLGRAEGARKSSDTYARRRARKAADELALIDPALWDDKTRQIVATLATMAAPSRIDDVLAEHLPPVALCNCDDGRTHPIGEPPCVLADDPLEAFALPRQDGDGELDRAHRVAQIERVHDNGDYRA